MSEGTAYDAAVRALYQAPQDGFVAERKRLADELRAAGDRAAATRLGKLPRPTISAWVVNQLYWHARDQFDAMLAAAQRLRNGELAANASHQEAIARLRQRASNILSDAGHAATEASLRRVTTNLSAIAAVGGFEPDQPGTLTTDREAPGFTAAGLVAAPAVVSPQTSATTAPSPTPAVAVDTQRVERERARQEQQRVAAQRARQRAERERVAAALRTARGELDAGERRIQAAERELAEAKAAATRRRDVVEDLERKLEQMPED
jgi:hypothetical protein